MAARHFTIVGSGLAGTLAAIYLARAGHPVHLYEKRPDPREGEFERGRSINLALSTRGLQALAEVGLDQAALAISIPMKGRMIHGSAGNLTFQPYGKDPTQVLHSISRSALNRLLVTTATSFENVKISFNHRCTGFDVSKGTLEFLDAKANTSVSIAAACVVGADGAFSVIRSAFQRLDRFNYQQDFLTHGYKELTIPSGPDGIHRLDKHSLHIWPRGQFMMIALPNLDGSFTGTLFWPFEGPMSFAALDDEHKVTAFFKEHFADVPALIPDLGVQFLKNPTLSLVTIRCLPWHYHDRAVLVGDACHAVVPFLGQGMNAAFEDCSVLMNCLHQEPLDVSRAFARYESMRKQHTDVLADLCLANFVEMRDRVASPCFIVRKRVQVLMHRLLPHWYIPLYSLIEFTSTPYADAQRRSRRQNRILFFLVGLFLALLLTFIVVFLFR